MNEESTIHEKYMRRCLELAKKGMGRVAPNPMVGSVIVYNNEIIGEGFHQNYGEAHAEVNAVNSVKDARLLEKSTLYVNLEPCAHYGKTPPCSLLIIEKKIKKVVIGCVDTFSKVSGKGIKMMEEKGIEVITGVLEAESRAINKRFFTFHEQKRPYVILKWAETRDGFIDKNRNATEKAAWITNDYSRVLVHKMRAEEDAILVGTETALKDNPKLNIRAWSGTNPTRVVLDRTNRLPKNLHLLDGSQPTLVFTENKLEPIPNVEFIPILFSQDVIPQILEELHKRNILSLIVEGGTQTLQSFIDLNLWDEAHQFIGNVQFLDGVKAPVFRLNPSKTQHIDGVMLNYYQKG